MRITKYDWMKKRIVYRRAIRRLATGQSARINEQIWQYCTPHKLQITQAKLAVDALIKAIDHDLRLIKSFREQLGKLKEEEGSNE